MKWCEYRSIATGPADACERVRSALARRMARSKLDRLPSDAFLAFNGDTRAVGLELHAVHEPAAPLRTVVSPTPGTLPDIDTMVWVAWAALRAMSRWEAAEGHGGITPECFFIDRWGRLKIGDVGIVPALIDAFGLANLATIRLDAPIVGDGLDSCASGCWSASASSVSETVGWLGPYCAHELAGLAQEPTRKTDQFALGVALFVMAAGRHPYGCSLTEPDIPQFVLDPFAISELREEWHEIFRRIDKGLARRDDAKYQVWSSLVEKLIASDPSHRFKDFAEAFSFLQPIVPSSWSNALEPTDRAMRAHATGEGDWRRLIGGLARDQSLPAPWRAILEARLKEEPLRPEPRPSAPAASPAPVEARPKEEPPRPEPTLPASAAARPAPVQARRKEEPPRPEPKVPAPVAAKPAPVEARRKEEPQQPKPKPPAPTLATPTPVEARPTEALPRPEPKPPAPSAAKPAPVEARRKEESPRPEPKVPTPAGIKPLPVEARPEPRVPAPVAVKPAPVEARPKEEPRRPEPKAPAPAAAKPAPVEARRKEESPRPEPKVPPPAGIKPAPVEARSEPRVPAPVAVKPARVEARPKEEPRRPEPKAPSPAPAASKTAGHAATGEGISEAQAPLPVAFDHRRLCLLFSGLGDARRLIFHAAEAVHLGRNRRNADVLLRCLPRSPENDRKSLLVSGSKPHARLALGPEGLTLSDLESRNGTSLNGARVRGDARVPIDRTSEIVFAGVIRMRLTPILGEPSERSPGLLADVAADALWNIAEYHGLNAVRLDHLDATTPQESHLVIYRSCTWTRSGRSSSPAEQELSGVVCLRVGGTLRLMQEAGSGANLQRVHSPVPDSEFRGGWRWASLDAS